jgi:hypothetical protein
MEGSRMDQIFSLVQHPFSVLAFSQAQGSIGVETEICQVERHVHYDVAYWDACRRADNRQLGGRKHQSISCLCRGEFGVYQIW